MTPADHIAALRRESNRIASAAEGRLDRIVPSCPGWRIADLVWHVGIVQMFWQMVARGALSGPEAWSEPDRPTDGDLVAWFRGGVDASAATLEGLSPDTPAWTWGHRQDVGFIRRRVAQETAVHCWDAVNAIEANEPIEQTVAVDGVDEFLDEVLPGLSPDLDGPAQTICMRTSDTTDRWIVRTGEGCSELIPASDQGDATVTATASDLLLLLWGRRSPNQVQVDGNTAALQRFLTRADF
ncbi:maleylpyruvate isomerase family mycothiol-dependent enzyme [Mycobacterium sp. ML4]